MDNLLSKDECAQIIENLIKSKDFSILDYQIVSIDDGYPGYLGDYFRLEITFDNGQDKALTKKFFVKTLPMNNVEKRELIQKWGIYEKEVLIYRHLVPELLKYSGDSKWCPRCCLVRDDLLVLEDLKVDGYQITPIRYEYNQSHIHEVLKSFAVFHSSSIAFETFELKPAGTTIGEKYKNMLFETSLSPDNCWYQTGLKGLKTVILHETKYGVGSQYENFIEMEFEERMKEIYKFIDERTSSKIPKVWIHRDIWKNNLMFKFEKNLDGEDDLSKPLHCLFVDFQISRCLPITIDVLLVILLCTRARHFKVHMDHYLKFYYEHLTNELSKHNLKIEEICTWKNFIESINEVMLLPRMMNPLYMSVTHLPDGILGNLSVNNPKEYNRVLNVNRGDFLLEYMKKDEEYRSFLVEALEDLIEFMFSIK